ncbi:2OG-Fe(II) oxygenase [Acinetobacter bereziniae]|uniref:2OG-Fe(II) oxygenase n=1 Tax=Acinetobacter bereziniae TaxID=106648 RepID=UPI00158109A9|nr:2OG-Fe(II) oxygenase [Acinetobacter bereziniae]NUF63854.1 2OG-Fe(II) oxygenase [Acinetobacter bereziniae]NUG07511.1 2OG-Fe(II) oxygenase [Acinetobacter bereziniae]NUG65711.1 2OG-Fe(II) oxygenase [Acinetobacter bereziniae]NUG70394.1 2OG-Fe(II) oxygenase [Acinetobacter bereziniae]NUG82020.1 2OG-Fe(II) oxygenase [Acinetobacter bereziniae]
MTSILKLDALKNAEVVTTPYPFFVVENALADSEVQAVIKDFPKIEQGGSFNIEDVEIKPNFDRFLKSLDTPEFRQILTDKFDVNVMEHPMMITLRGYSRQKDGRIHNDSKSKLLTILIYLNESWDAPNGRLRILNDDKDINNYVAEIGAGPGSLVAFKVTDNGWHGYIPYEGQRQSIQINFLTSEKANAKHKFFHGLSAKVKKIFG